MSAFAAMAIYVRICRWTVDHCHVYIKDLVFCRMGLMQLVTIHLPVVSCISYFAGPTVHEDINFNLKSMRNGDFLAKMCPFWCQ